MEKEGPNTLIKVAMYTNREEGEPATGHVPEKALLEAMLFRACADCFISKNSIDRNARGWLLSSSREPWSFLWVAEELGLGSRVISRLRRVPFLRLRPAGMVKTSIARITCFHPTNTVYRHTESYLKKRKLVA